MGTKHWLGVAVVAFITIAVANRVSFARNILQG